MIKVEFNNKSVNPYNDMPNTLRLFQNGSKGSVSEGLLESCYKECGSDKDKKALLFSILFSIGDITNRNHNIFKGDKRDKGGYAEREAFRDVIIPFMYSKIKRHGSISKMYFLNLITEYTVMDNILALRVKTKKNTSNVIKVIDMVSVFGIETVVEYCTTIFQNGNDFQKLCLAKYLTIPRAGKLPQTKNLQSIRRELLTKFCDSVGLQYEEKENYMNFFGYRNWRKKYNSMFESVLFSTGTIKNIDKEKFFNLIEQMPSSARYRTRCRLLTSKDEPKNNEKYGILHQWYLEWEKFKETKQTEQRVLETKISSGTATEKDKADLHKVKQQAKVNTGAVNFRDLMDQVIRGTVDKIKVQPFLDTISLPYNTLVFVDDSGSMHNTGWGHSHNFSPRDFGAFIASICLMKNPDAEARNLMGLFSRNCRFLSARDKQLDRPNSLLKGVAKDVNGSIYDTEKHFLDNLHNIKGMLNYYAQGSLTNVSSIFNTVKHWVDTDPTAIDALQRYPVWTLISDGNFNNLGNATSSLNQFFMWMETKIGFKPYIVLIDVAGNSSQDIRNFTGVENMMYVPPSPANIELFLTNFKDMDTYDVYTPLLSLSRTNRYQEVKQMFLGETDKGQVEASLPEDSYLEV